MHADLFLSAAGMVDSELSEKFLPAEKSEKSASAGSEGGRENHAVLATRAVTAIKKENMNIPFPLDSCIYKNLHANRISIN